MQPTLPLPLTCRDIQLILFQHADRVSTNIIAFNTTRVLRHETDVLVLRKSGVTVEYEVKVSYADFKADFRKTAKHNELKARHVGGPQYFYFACQPGLIKEADVPYYAGLVYVHSNRRAATAVEMVKEAPRLHRVENAGIHERICRSLMYKAVRLDE